MGFFVVKGDFGCSWGVKKLGGGVVCGNREVFLIWMGIVLGIYGFVKLVLIL